MSRRMVASALTAGLLGLLGGCAKYEPRPIVPEEVVAQAEETRARPDGPDLEAASPDRPVGFVQAARWMRAHGPDIREALAAYRTALARAQHKTPLPNPGLEIGPQFGFGPDQGSVNKWAPFGSIGFAFPLGKRLRRQDELNRALAEVARIDAVARHRELYLLLRERYTQKVLARQRLDTHAKLVEAAERSAKSARTLVEAGQATALDVAVFDLELAQGRSSQLEAHSEAAVAELDLARLSGVKAIHFEHLPDEPLPALPEELPAEAELREKLVREHNELARLRARYEAAERGLRLEIARQYPDFTFGPSFDNESGEKRTVIGLALGIELPLFDRNQQGIAEAQQRREEVRVQYEAAANRALADLDAARLTLGLAKQRRALLRAQILPSAQSLVEAARKALAAGDQGALRLIDAERTFRKVQLDAWEAEWQERAAWVALERAVGHPLLRFPDEDERVAPPEGSEAGEVHDDTPKEQP